MEKLSLPHNLLRIFAILLISFSSSCFWNAKKNLDNLKKCKFELIDLIIRTEPNLGFSLIPKVSITPVVSITNPNDEDVEIYKFNLDIFLVTGNEKQKIGTVTNSEMLVIQKLSSSEINLQLDLDQKNGIDAKFISLILQLIQSASRGTESVILIQGEMLLNSSFGSISLPISETQKLKLQK